MKVLVVAYGAGDAASTTYRFRACQTLWAAQGHEMEIVSARNPRGDWGRRLGEYDAIINQKALRPLRFGRLLFGAGRPVFFDFDDAIWTRPRKPYSWWTQWRVNRRIRFWFSRAQRIFAANEHLAAFARRHQARVTVVPMALDLETWRPRAERFTAGVRIGWAGSPGNLWHLEKLRGPLQRILSLHPEVRLAVFCGRRPGFDFPFEHVPFAPGKEVEFVRELDIGLLPLENDPYTLGKSPIKALQYLSCAVPVVGNVRGATAEILNPESSLAVQTEQEWMSALRRLIAHPTDRAALGQAGRRFVERHHNLRNVSQQLLNLLSAEYKS
jgi:glycosyltransferase involved in cell wall biosynthesis